MLDVHGRVIANHQVARPGAQARVSIAVRRIDEERYRDRRLDPEVLDHDGLSRRPRRMDVEDEIARVAGDLVLQLDEELEPDHLTVAIA